jgi:hypothetical protein
MNQFLSHLRRNAVAYLALMVALGTSTAYAATALPNGSVTAAKLHTNAVTSTKIKNGTVKTKDLKKPTYVQSADLGLGTPPAVPDLVSVAPYDFTLPTKARTSVTVFIPTIGGGCDGIADQPTIGLYIDNVPIAGTAATVPGAASDRSVLLTATLLLGGGAHTGRVGITCNGASAPSSNLAYPGAKSWTIIQAD